MVFTSPFADIRPPEKFKDSLGLFFAHQLDKHANNTLLVDFSTGREWTGEQLKCDSYKIASFLVEELKLKPADSCVFFYPNCDYTQLVALGVLFAGGSVCVGAPRDPLAEHKYMLESMKPRVVFTETRLLQEMVTLRDSTGLNFNICLIDDDDVDDDQTNSKLTADYTFGLKRHLLAHQVCSNVNQLLPVLTKPDDPAFILFTSGSTGHPKPVARSHRNSIYVCFSLNGPANELWPMDENSVLAGHLQLDHGTGTFSIKMTLAKGLKLIVMDGYEQDTLLEAIQRYQITDCMLGSALLHNLMSTPADKLGNLSSLRNMIFVGSRIPSHSLAIDFMNRNPNMSVRQSYGMTECGFISAVPASDCRSDSQSVGSILPNIRLKLVDPVSGREITECKREGELLVAGPTVSPGYLGARFDEQSRKAFLDDGFYRSYDICSIGSSGRLVVRGRANETLCLTDGWKVLPAEIESTILQHPGVREVAVIGIPHPNLPTCHAVRAYVRPADEWRCKLSEREVFDFAAARLSEPKHLHGGVKILNELPRISVGKVDKKALRKMDGY